MNDLTFLYKLKMVGVIFLLILAMLVFSIFLLFIFILVFIPMLFNNKLFRYYSLFFIRRTNISASSKQTFDDN